MFNDVLKQLRNKAGMNQEQLAKRLGLSKSAISMYESGSREPSLEILEAIADIFNVDMNTLTGAKKLSESVNGSDELSSAEKQHIKKYRSLDHYGQKAVDNLMDIELERCSLVVELPRLITLPMVELKASAGTGQWLGDDEYTTRVDVLDTPEARRANVVIEVSGDSMEPRYHDGDKVLVKLQPTVEQNEIGIFIVDNCGYIKKLGVNELISVNKEYDNIPLNEYNDVTCVGKVVGIAEII